MAFNWFETIHRILRYYNPLPTWDYWRVAASIHSYESFDFRILWRQHNEHRIIFPEIVFAADMLLLHGRELLPLALSFLCYATTWIVLAWAFWQDNAVSPLVRAIGILLAGILIGWEGSAAVLASPFLFQWTLLEAMVLLSLAFLSCLNETGKNVYLAGVILSAIIATYSAANGMLLWPVLLSAGLFLRLKRRQLIVLSIASASSIGVYFIGYHFTANLALSNFFRHPLYLLEFVASYLSMPFGAMKSSQFGVGLGIVSLCTVAGLAVLAVRKRLLYSRAGIVLFGWYLFSLLTALLTAAGRMDVTDLGFSGAKPPRYLTVPLLTWAVFVLLGLWLTLKSRWKVASSGVTTFLVASLLLLGLPKLRWWLQARDDEQANEQLATLAVQDGLNDPSVFLKIFPDPASVNLWLSGLRQRQLSIFYNARSRWLGLPVRRFALPVTTVVPGEVTYTFPVISGVEVAGWADEFQLRGGTGWIVFTNESDQIVGFGRKVPAGFPTMVRSPRTPPSLGWVGFVNLRFPTKSFCAYVVNKRGLLPIQGPTPVPRDAVVSPAEVGPSISGIQWQMDPSWTVNSLPPRVPFGPSPAGPVYSSWSGSDKNTGRIRSSDFAAPANACLILPNVNGPVATGLSAEILDADKNEVIAAAPFQNGSRGWAFWRISIPASIKHLRISAEDGGTNWGEWLAIGTPKECR